jgi:hypothetical protein
LIFTVIFAIMLQKQDKAAAHFRRSLGVLCCLLPFLLGQFQQVVRHQLEHSHLQAEQHSPEQEADACHQSIFHAGAAQACSHPAHLTHYEQQCELCDSILLPLYFALRELSVPHPDLPNYDGFYYQSAIGFNLGQAANARAPPTEVLA